MAGLQAGILALSVLIVLVACISGGSANVSFQEQLLARIDSLEKQGLAQAVKFQNMEIQLNGQTERLENQEKTISEYKEKVRELERTVQKLVIGRKSDISDDPEYVKNDDKGKSGGNNQGTMKPISDVTRQRRMLMDDVSPVAFNARIAESAVQDHLEINQKIVFPDVTLNHGGGYHNRTGVFIAPMPGIYLFSTTITSAGSNHKDINTNIVQNGNHLGEAYARSDSNGGDQGSVTVVTQMATGDEVWVSVGGEADTSLWGGEETHFMGCLISPL